MAKVKTIEIVDIENVRNEKLRYQKNSISYLLGLLGVLMSLFAGFVGLNTVYPKWIVTVKIGLNVIILLFGFASAENIKNYRKSAAYIFFAFAVIDVLRIFWYPVTMISKWRKYESLKYTDLPKAKLILSENFSKVVSTNQDAGRGWLPQSGTFRGIFMMIFLIVSAVLFAFSGYIGLSKTNRLQKYLKSINVEF